MKEVMQTKFGAEGNCLQACMASLFDLDIDEIPDFQSTKKWLHDLSDWSFPRLGKHVIRVVVNEKAFLKGFHDCLFIAVVESNENGPWTHAIIIKGDRVVFDPVRGKVDESIKMEDIYSILVFFDHCH